MFDPMCDIPETDEEARIALQRDDEIVTKSLVSLYELDRLEGKTVLEAFRATLETHVAVMGA